MAWLITWQNIAVHGKPLKDNPRHPICSTNWDFNKILLCTAVPLHTFRLLDDDGIVYYHGVSTVKGFAPLDDYGRGNDGCTEIQYRNEDGHWETL